MPSALFALITFQTGSQVFHSASLDCDPSIYASCIDGTTVTHHHTQILVEMGGGLTNFLPGLVSDHGDQSPPPEQLRL
jgi:hypothetical protein